MAWTSPITWTNILSDASDFNEQIRDNLLALKAPVTQNYSPNEGSDYTKTAGAYGNVDATHLNFTLSTTGGDVMVGFIGSGKAPATRTGHVDIEVDGTRIAAASAGGCIQIIPVSANAGIISFVRIIRGLSAGSHTFKLQFQTDDSFTIYAGAGTANYDIHGRFWAREIS